MKSRWVKTGIGSIIFLMLVAAVFLVLQPVYRGVSNVMHQNEQKLLDTLADTTGSGISYKSLSPSILSGIHIKGIEVYDISTRKNLLTVDKAVLKYRLFKLLKGDFENAFTGLTISGVVFQYDDSEDSAFKKKMTELMNAGTDSQDKDQNVSALLSDEVIEQIRTTLFSLPFSILIKNVSAKYSNDQVNASMKLNTITLKKGADGNSLSGVLDGELIADVSLLDHHTVGFDFSLDGKLLREISGSSAIFSLFQNNDADFSVSKSVYLIRYNDRNLVLRSLQNNLPLSLYAGINLDSGDCVADVSMKNFYPLSTVKLRSVPDNIEPFVSTSINTSAQVSYNVIHNSIGWHADGDLSLSKNIAPDGEKIGFNVDGDDEYITVSSLTADGSIATAQFIGSYHIPTMQPSGTLVLDKYRLPNNNTISGEMYIDPLDVGFTCMVPQLTIGTETLSAVQMTLVPKSDSYDFTVSLNDYAHTDFDQPAEIKIDGSYTMGEHQYLQASVSIGNIFLDSIANLVASCVDAKTASSIKSASPALAPFVFTNELYISTDFKSFSFNSPYSVLANTKQDKQFLLLSFDGNENSVSISQFDLIYGKQTVRATLDADISPQDQQVLFSTECMVNSIPYHLRGNYQFGKWLELTGDYGLNVAVNFNKDITGTLQFASFPLAIDKYILSSTSEMHFSFSNKEGFVLNLDRFEVEEVSGNVASAPKLALEGRVNQQGLVLSSVSYTDKSSSLDGGGEVFWNINDDIFDSVTAHFTMESPVTAEKLSLSGNFTNPKHVSLDGDHLMNDYYFTAEANVTSFPLSRLMSGQLDDDTLSAQVNASGTISNPYISVVMNGFSMQFNGAPLIAKGAVAYEDGSITVPEMECSWSGMKISDTRADFNVSDFAGKITSQFNFEMGDKTLYAPFAVNIENLSGPSTKGGAPDSFVIELNSDSITGTLLNEPLPVQIICLRTTEGTVISSSDNLGISGKVSNDGAMNFEISSDKPFHGKMSGKNEGPNMDMNCTDIYCDLSKIAFLFNSPYFTAYQGIIKGNVRISGLGTDPDLDGKLTVTNLDFNLPSYVPEHFKTKKMVVDVNQDTIAINNAVFDIANSALSTKLSIGIDRWTFESFSAAFKSIGSKGIPVDINVPFLRIKGTTGIDVALNLADNLFDVNGSISLDNSEITAMTNLQNTGDSSSGNSDNTMDMRISLNLLIGQRVQIALNPLLRGVVAPQTPITFTMNTADDTWNIKGDIVLRGGELSYLSRNFYLKEGRIILNETQNSF